MENKTEMSLSRAWKEFKESLCYAVEAKKGKFSLNVYLNRLSDSIDAYIKEMKILNSSQDILRYPLNETTLLFLFI